jgi:hypothetical protein
MNILTLAESDLASTLEDVDNGFGVNISLIEDDNIFPVVASVSDVGYFIDPQTGVGVCGRTCEITIRISSLLKLSLDPPDENWICQYTDKSGDTWKSSIVQVRPDRTLGVYNISLEAYDDSED